MSTPLIGLTTWRKEAGASGASWSVRQSYCDAIAAHGAAPLLVPCSLTTERLRALVDKLDGLVLTGGGDVHPRFYEDKPGEQLDDIDETRDEAEITLARFAIEASLPLLGICRGLQVLNVTLGGTLYQDISASIPNALLHDHKGEPATHLAHPVSIEPTSMLGELIDVHEIGVNSRHHQAIRQIAPGLQCSARSPDDLVEAAELPDMPFVLGVQWHPESLHQRPESQALFQAFIHACQDLQG